MSARFVIGAKRLPVVSPVRARQEETRQPVEEVDEEDVEEEKRDEDETLEEEVAKAEPRSVNFEMADSMLIEQHGRNRTSVRAKVFKRATNLHVKGGFMTEMDDLPHPRQMGQIPILTLEVVSGSPALAGWTDNNPLGDASLRIIWRAIAEPSDCTLTQLLGILLEKPLSNLELEDQRDCDMASVTTREPRLTAAVGEVLCESITLRGCELSTWFVFHAWSGNTLRTLCLDVPVYPSCSQWIGSMQLIACYGSQRLCTLANSFPQLSHLTLRVQQSAVIDLGDMEFFFQIVLPVAACIRFLALHGGRAHLLLPDTPLARAAWDRVCNAVNTKSNDFSVDHCVRLSARVHGHKEPPVVPTDVYGEFEELAGEAGLDEQSYQRSLTPAPFVKVPPPSKRIADWLSFPHEIAAAVFRAALQDGGLGDLLAYVLGVSPEPPVYKQRSRDAPDFSAQGETITVGGQVMGVEFYQPKN